MAEQWKIIGHQKIAAFLDNIASRNNPASAYLFSGVNHLGKSLIAEKFSQKLLQKNLSGVPDFYRLQVESGKKDISIEQVREFKNLLQLKTFGGSYKIGIIQEAEKLNQESGNALLKIIEEPSSDAVLIIITSFISRMLPTIASRTQILNFLPVPLLKLRQGLKKMYPEKDDIEINQAAFLSAGRPGIAINLLENKDLLCKHMEKVKQVENILAITTYKRLDKVDNLLETSTDNAQKSRSAYETLDFIEAIYRQKFIINPAIEFIEKFKNINSARGQLLANVQPKLVLENLFINL